MRHKCNETPATPAGSTSSPRSDHTGGVNLAPPSGDELRCLDPSCPEAATYRGQPALTSEQLGITTISGSNFGDSSWRHLTCPAHSVALDPIVRLAREAPVADGWMQGHNIIVLRQAPLGWIERGNNSKTAATTA